jgi:hypothetical protein
MKVYEGKPLGGESRQLILENRRMRVLILPEIGGRIIDIEAGGFRYLHRTYPDPLRFGPYIEYGGIEECIGKAPGMLWNSPWRVERGESDVTLSSISATSFSRVLVEKRIQLDEELPILRIRYSLINIQPKFNKFTFGIHPEINLGGKLGENSFFIPSVTGIVTGKGMSPGYKRFIEPSEGWYAISYDDRIIGMLFPDDVIDMVELYYPRVGTHMVLQPLIYGVGLSPNRRASFTCLIYAGEGDINLIRSIRARRKEELIASYEPIEPLKMRELEEREFLRVEPRPRVPLPFEEMMQDFNIGRPLKGIPKLPGGNERIRHSFRGVSFINLSGGLGDVSLEPSRGDEVSVEYVVQGFAPGSVTIKQFGEELRINTESVNIKVDYRVRIPEDVNSINVSFINGEVSIRDIPPLTLKVKGVDGRVKFAGAVKSGAGFELNTVSASIEVVLTPDSSCRISGTTLSGRLECVLDLEVEESIPGRVIEGRFNGEDGSLRVNSVGGDIRFTANHISDDP